MTPANTSINKQKFLKFTFIHQRTLELCILALKGLDKLGMEQPHARRSPAGLGSPALLIKPLLAQSLLSQCPFPPPSSLHEGRVLLWILPLHTWAA